MAFGPANGTAGNGSSTSSSYPTRFVQGCLVSYASATTASVTAGSWRDSADAADVRSFPAVASVDCTSAGAAGIDQTVIAQTGASTSPTITASASILSNFNTATLTGTISTSTTALSGSGSKFTTELCVGDLVGTAAKGFSRITAIASDTAATLVAALPGGDQGAGGTGVRYNTPTIWIGATATDKRLVNTISAAGTAIVVDIVPGAISAIGAGATLTIGVAPNLASEATINYWLHLWVRSGASGTTAAWSTQGRTPYAISGYSTSVRRVGSFPIVGGNATPVLAFAYQYEIGGLTRGCLYEDSGSTHNLQVLSAGTATSYTSVTCANAIPPSGVQGLFSVEAAGTAASMVTAIGQDGTQTGAGTRPIRGVTQVSGTVPNPLTVWCNVSARQYIQYSGSSASCQTSIFCAGFIERL